ncbi:hypothetical protein POM88_020781 [Heracleum sosnowskyi]|uniref:Helitron helicase-like domain-containing protein n=1 Tax=Heracleum sosnowskyi TaxID=360622 RepID=A0AAD8ICL9_9APIA|nr:hypothetical protein POM88_020781 [Heracleum sosnowskyi]
MGVTNTLQAVVNTNVEQTFHREPFSNITNQNNQSITKSRKDKGKGKIRQEQSTRNLFEEEFSSTLQESSGDYYDQLEHSIIADSEYNEDGSDDSNDEYCTEERWGDILDNDYDVDQDTTKGRDMISMKDYYSYIFQIRENEGMSARVFKMKLDQMTNDIKKKSYFGKCAGIMYVVEFQKRGLPHRHMLIWLDSESKRVFNVSDTFLRITVPGLFLTRVVSQFTSVSGRTSPHRKEKPL